jgi:nucleoside-diphosphate-sugar epimerase
MNPQTLIVGGSGFLGGHLTRRLLHLHREVTHLSLQNRPARPTPPGVHQCHAAEPTAESIAAALDGHRFDTVFLLAAAGVDPRNRSLSTLLEGNLQFPGAVLEALQSCRPRIIVHTGSWMEYDPIESGALLTESHPLGGVEPYGASKAAGELWLRALARQFDLPLVRLRLFQIFGSGEAPHRLLPVLRERLTQRLPVSLSPGHQIRDFLYVEDALDGLLAAAQTPLAGEAYNLCSGLPLSVADFARAVARSLDSPEDLLRFGEIAQRPGELPWAVGNGQRLFQAAGWRPRWNLTSALAHLSSMNAAPAGQGAA